MFRRMVYVTSERLRIQCDKIPVVKMRASMVHHLLSAYELDNDFTLVEPELATADDLRLFHSSNYVDYLMAQNDKDPIRVDMDQTNDSADDPDEKDDDTDEDEDVHEEHGIGYDCPRMSNLCGFSKTIAGASLTAANELMAGASVVVNWCGGWHHAQRDGAEGFCYVNDIAIAIQRMRNKFQRILYLDLDVHHGNGVENAFAYTKHVFSLSFHQREPGFFPGSGSLVECGSGPGIGYSCNFPYKSFVTGELFCRYFSKVTQSVLEAYNPDACVVQCGADAIAGDPLGGTNLTAEDFGQCVGEILNWKLPTIFLGGGGYNLPNTARYWTYLTSMICGRQLEDDIPDHKYFLKYGPGYELRVQRKPIKDLNEEAEFEANWIQIKAQLYKYVTKHS